MEPKSKFDRDFWQGFRPSHRQALPDWVESNIVLSARAAPVPGRMRLWKYQRGILDAIGSHDFPQVSIIKAVRLGFTKCIISALGFWASERPSATLLLMPTEDDCARVSRDEVSPMFAESPTLQGLLLNTAFGDRETLTTKFFAKGGSLKIVAARSPRNLRSHDVKILLGDEIDAMVVTEEGDPIELAIKRTIAHDDRKIIMGSTPTIDGLSNIQKLYNESDRRIFEVPCPHCFTPFEILWEHVTWTPGNPADAYVVCPHCGCAIDESEKPKMIEAGEWRATAPEVKGHAGFRLNSLISMFRNERWGHLAKKFTDAKNNPSRLMVFENTSLGKCSKQSIDNIDPFSLQARVEDFSLDDLPPEVLMITCGVDVQNDRLEACFLGWSKFWQPFVLAHVVLHGSTIEQKTWMELDHILARKFQHSVYGYPLPIEATAIDYGGTGTGTESRPQAVLNFTAPRGHRHIYAVKGIGGQAPRPMWQQSFSAKSGAAKFFSIDVNRGKVEVLERLAALPYLDTAGEPTHTPGPRNPFPFRFSNSLPEQFFEQVASERRYVRYLHNRPIVEFRPIEQGARNEALDALNYAYIVAKGSCTYVNMRERDARRAPPNPKFVPVRTRSMADFGNFSRHPHGH